VLRACQVLRVCRVYHLFLVFLVFLLVLVGVFRPCGYVRIALLSPDGAVLTGTCDGGMMNGLFLAYAYALASALSTATATRGYYLIYFVMFVPNPIYLLYWCQSPRLQRSMNNIIGIDEGYQGLCGP